MFPYLVSLTNIVAAQRVELQAIKSMIPKTTEENQDSRVVFDFILNNIGGFKEPSC
jgi:hypothetical protein